MAVRALTKRQLSVREQITKAERELRKLRTEAAQGTSGSRKGVRIAVTFDHSTFAALRTLAAKRDISISSLIASYALDGLANETEEAA